MEKLRQQLKPFLNFYVIVGVFAMVWMVFFDQNNWLDRMERSTHIQQLEKDLAFYKSEKEKIQESRFMLESDAAELERFARERYHMKKDNEDLFLIVDPKK